jgi:hypothetical protein
MPALVAGIHVLNPESTQRRGWPRPNAAALARLLVKAKPGLQLSEDLDRPGDVVFEHACMLGLEGIVSKRRGSRYESGRSSHWLKIKNPNHPAVLRLLEGPFDYGRKIQTETLPNFRNPFVSFMLIPR